MTSVYGQQQVIWVGEIDLGLSEGLAMNPKRHRQFGAMLGDEDIIMFRLDMRDPAIGAAQQCCTHIAVE
jgi:hypothetical protein